MSRPPESTPQPPRHVVSRADARRPLLPKALWGWVLGAFALGLLLFLMLWWDQRNDGDFFKVQGTATGEGRELPSLPAPLPEDVMVDAPAALPDATTAGMEGEQPRIVEPPAPAPPPPAPVPTAPPAPPIASNVPDQPPRAISSPAPDYPRNAQRRGIGGTVVIRVDVTGRGDVESLELEQSSGDRDLDRAALQAVRRWRFDPATRDGRPVAASVRVPINFQAR